MKHAKFTILVDKVLVVIFTVCFSISAMLPVLYAIFGLPKPQLWALPLQTRQVLNLLTRDFPPSFDVGPLFSSLLGQTTYIGFYVDWLIEVVAIVAGFTILAAASSLFIGMFVYINATIADSRMRLSSIEPGHAIDQSAVKFWPVYLREINFHIDIIRWILHLSEAFKSLLSLNVEHGFVFSYLYGSYFQCCKIAGLHSRCAHILRDIDQRNYARAQFVCDRTDRRAEFRGARCLQRHVCDRFSVVHVLLHC